MNKTYVIDWGIEANGGRFALIQAPSISKAWMDADMVGCPERIAELVLKPFDYDGGDMRYVEIDQVGDPWTGETLCDSIEGWTDSP